MTDAKLYEVQTARGMVYALHDGATGLIWTERSELAAREVARERGLSITEELTISHEQLLRLIGHEPPPPPKKIDTGVLNVPDNGVGYEMATLEGVDGVMPSAAGFHIVDSDGSAPAAPAAPPPLPFPVRYHLEDEPVLPVEDAPVIARIESPKVKGVFCSDSEIAPVVPKAIIENSVNKAHPQLDQPT